MGKRLHIDTLTRSGLVRLLRGRRRYPLDAKRGGRGADGAGEVAQTVARRRSTSDPLRPRPRRRAVASMIQWYFLYLSCLRGPQHVLPPTDGRLPAVLGIFYDNLSNYTGPTVELHLHHIRHGRSLKCDQAEEGKTAECSKREWEE